MRIVLWVIGIPLVVIALGAILIPLFLDEQALVELAAEQIKAKTGVILEVEGEASLTLFPKVSLATTGVSIDIPESQTRIRARSLSTGVALLPLLTKTVEIDSITVDGLIMTSVAVDEAAAKVAAMDTSTLSNKELDAFYQARGKAREIARAQAAASVLAVPLALEVGELALTDIRVITEDAAGAPISELQLRSLRATGLNIEGRPVPLRAEIFIPGEDGAAAMEITVNAEFTTDIKSELLTLNALTVAVTGATQEPLSLQATGTVALNTQVADLSLSLASGDLKGDGKLRFAMFESPQIDATLALTELNPALLVLAGPDAAAAQQNVESAESAGGDTTLPLHTLRMIDTRAVLSIDTVVLDAHRLENVQATLRVVDGVATLEPVTATVHGGAINVKAVLNGRYNRATLLTAGGVQALDIARAVAAAELGVAATGTADLTWTLDAAGASSDELGKSLEGPISFKTRDITLQGIAMEQMFCRGVALVNQAALSAEFPSDTRFEALSADIQLANGVAKLDPLTAQLPAVGLTGTGSLDITTSDLRASFRAQLSPELGELDPACLINERYTDLRWPVECKGNLAGDPASWCGVNTTEIIKDLAEGEAKRKLQKEAGRFLKKLIR